MTPTHRKTSTPTHMKTSTHPPKRRVTFKYITLLSSLLFLPVLYLFLHVKHNLHPTAIVDHSLPHHVQVPDIRIRSGYTSYKTYLLHQLNKTLNPKLRKVWTTRDWDRKIQVFSEIFTRLKQEKLLSNNSRALCIGARVGQEVQALKRVGVNDSIGIDLVPYPPLVVEGDFHSQPFQNETFDFEFSNVFDHALYPRKFVAEIERTLRPRGVCVLHVAISKRGDKYSANDLFSVRPLVEMFRRSEMVYVRKVDGFGLDTEVVFRKREVKLIQQR
ncbi:hypothetical protein ABKV19_015882 [Rosa sericea]